MLGHFQIAHRPLSAYGNPTPVSRLRVTARTPAPPGQGPWLIHSLFFVHNLVFCLAFLDRSLSTHPGSLSPAPGSLTASGLLAPLPPGPGLRLPVPLPPPLLERGWWHLQSPERQGSSPAALCFEGADGGSQAQGGNLTHKTVPRERGLSPGGQGWTRQESWREWGLVGLSHLREGPKAKD